MEHSFVESILSLFIFQDAYVVSFLVAGIMIIVLLLLMYNFKSPESVVMNEVNNSDNIEGALRRVLGEKSWVGAVETNTEASEEAVKKIGVLEKEVLTKDKEIADLHKQLTQGGNGAAGGSGNDEELKAKIDELEARLQEYEIIEDDIADLSLYKVENEKLKKELDSLKAGGAPAAVETEPEESSDNDDDSMVTDDQVESLFEQAAKEEDINTEMEAGPVESDWSEADDPDAPNGRDLVAEFEKVVNNKDAIVSDEVQSKISKDTEDGNVVVKSAEPKESLDVVHPKLENVKPDSKEEAEVFIADLKSIKKGS